MRTIPAMVDLKRTPTEKVEEAQESGFAMPCAMSVSDYPYGLSVSFDEEVMEKIGMEIGDVEPGDILHLHCFATVTSVSQRTDNDKTCARVEAQITHIAAEDEAEENEEMERSESIATSFKNKAYNKAG